jgi:cytolysin-activating lysine-acyltransferase
VRVNNLKIIVPSLEANPLNEVETFGAAAWLWMQSDMHKGLPLAALNALLLPAIKTKQFMLAFEDDKPVAYIAWA